MRQFFFTLLFAFYGFQNASASSVSVDFYGEIISLEYDEKMVSSYNKSLLDEQAIETAFIELNERPTSRFISSVLDARAKYNLNDWLQTKLMFDALELICPSRSDRFVNMMTWVVLVHSGFDARATFTRSTIYVNVATQEEVFESPMYDYKGKSFANLTVLLRKGKFISVVNGVAFTPNHLGKDFSFSLQQLPELTPIVKTMIYDFEFKGKKQRISAKIDKTMVDMMKEYPKFDEVYYVTTPFSKVLRESILPELESAILGFTDKEKLEFLVTFTRTALKYGSDKKGFGTQNRPLTAEEALFYPLVDCEDKVAVIYNLVKELTPLNGVILALPNHLTFAVGLHQPVGKTYRHKGQKYTICDPTGPENTCEIGIFPNITDLSRAEVLGEIY